MSDFVKVLAKEKDFFTDREFEQEIIVGLNQISAIYKEQIVIGNNHYVRLAPESMKSLREYIDCADCTREHHCSLWSKEQGGCSCANHPCPDNYECLDFC